MAQNLDERQHAIRKTIVAFASLFKNIPFIKYENGVEMERIKVPVVYSNKEKYVKRLEGDPGEVDRNIQILLPRIEYGLLDFKFDASRKLNQFNKNIGCSQLGYYFTFSPVPYNFIFELTLYTRNIEDANQILEYILPNFQPDYYIKISMVPEAGITKTIPITLIGENLDEDSTGVFDSPVRSVFRTFQFIAQSYIYPQARRLVPILQAETNIYVDTKVKSYVLLSGSGTFNIGDTVYQGTSYDKATAIGIINTFSPLSNSVSIILKGGQFKANLELKNILNTAEYIISGANSTLALSSVITPVPNTYPPIGPYDYNIVITDHTA